MKLDRYTQGPSTLTGIHNNPIAVCPILGFFVKPVVSLESRRRTVVSSFPPLICFGAVSHSRI